jgi:phosphoenolpyruvate-protein kinase (PTS system EI component)
MKTLQGVAASWGIAIGPAFTFRRADLRFECRVVEDPAAEWVRCQDVLGTVCE